MSTSEWRLTSSFTAIPATWNLADLQRSLGDIPAYRVRVHPPLGWATKEDVVRLEAQEGILCELEYGVLVEKPGGWYESLLAALIIGKLIDYLEKNDLGHVLGGSGSLEILPGVVKIPDVSCISWSRFPDQSLPRRPVPSLEPDLAVEILSETNTKREMDAKLKRYFESGVRMVWYIDPSTRSAVNYLDADHPEEIGPDGALSGGDVLPGFRLSLTNLFQQADRQKPKTL